MPAPNARLRAVASQLSGTPLRGLLHSQVAIITGGAQGIGRACALLFAKEGAKVVVSDLDQVKANGVVDEIREHGGEAIAVGGDVTAVDFPQKLVAATIEAFGDINILLNMAGFTADRMLHTTPDEVFQLMLDVHNVAPFRLIREVAPYMRNKDSAKSGQNRSIINVSSTSGLHGNVGQANYATAKAGIQGLTKTVAKEWGPFGVRCNTVAFGYITTRLTQAKEIGETISVGGQQIPLGIPSRGTHAQTDASRVPDIPLGRPGIPEEAAQACLFLASELSGYISGHTLEVTGGRGI
ncbi:hypothetical protein JCM11641_003411 [Rhodosporidiobolus odoratus]